MNLFVSATNSLIWIWIRFLTFHKRRQTIHSICVSLRTQMFLQMTWNFFLKWNPIYYSYCMSSWSRKKRRERKTTKPKEQHNNWAKIDLLLWNGKDTCSYSENFHLVFFHSVHPSFSLVTQIYTHFYWFNIDINIVKNLFGDVDANFQLQFKSSKKYSCENSVLKVARM